MPTVSVNSIVLFSLRKFVISEEKGQKKSAETLREQLDGVNSLRRGEHIFVWIKLIICNVSWLFCSKYKNLLMFIRFKGDRDVRGHLKLCRLDDCFGIFNSTGCFAEIVQTAVIAVSVVF